MVIPQAPYPSKYVYPPQMLARNFDQTHNMYFRPTSFHTYQNFNRGRGRNFPNTRPQC